MKSFDNLFQKIEFNASNPTHLELFQRFLDTGKWSGCPFKLNEDYQSVPGMIYDMIKNELMKRVCINT